MFWFIVCFLSISVVLMIVGQTGAVFAYESTVSVGLQESVCEVGKLGVEVNKAFGAADTFVYVPLMIAALIGLLSRKDWSIYVLAAVGGISCYWTATVTFIMLLAPGTNGYR